jgi:drug/metabolite transporter (DMT)-like permease
MTVRKTHLDVAALAAMTGLCALWGLNQVAVKVANAGISPVLQAGLRSAGAALLLLAWSRWRGVTLFARDGTLRLGIVIAVLFSGEFALLYCGLEFTNASRAVLFLYTSPFVVAIGAHYLIPGERLRGIHVIGLAAAFAGIALTFGDALRLPTYREVLGDAMTLLAAIFWGATTVTIKATRLAQASAHKTLFYQLGGSAILLTALSPLLGEPGIFAPTPLVVVCFLYQLVVVAFASYLGWFWLITRYPAFKLSAVSFLTPLFGLVAGGVLLHEPITPVLGVAMVLVAIGIFLVNSPQPAPTERGGHSAAGLGD